MLQYNNKTKVNFHSEIMGHSPLNILFIDSNLKSEDYRLFTWTNEKGHQTPGPSPLTKLHRLINKFMNYALNDFLFVF